MPIDPEKFREEQEKAALASIISVEFEEGYLKIVTPKRTDQNDLHAGLQKLLRQHAPELEIIRYQSNTKADQVEYKWRFNKDGAQQVESRGIDVIQIINTAMPRSFQLQV